MRHMLLSATPLLMTAMVSVTNGQGSTYELRASSANGDPGDTAVNVLAPEEGIGRRDTIDEGWPDPHRGS